jgi:hypothetical protein
MKAIVKSSFILFLGIMLLSARLAAQEQNSADQPGTANLRMNPVLTDEQKTMLKNDIQRRKELREAFKATLTQEQKDMLTNPRMMKAERMKTFRASLSDQQVNIIKERQQEVKASRILFRSTLSDQQKFQFRRMAMNRSRMNRALLRRARIRHRLGGI